MGAKTTAAIEGGLILAIAFLVFWLSPVLQSGDSQYSMLLSENLIRYHSTFLDRYVFPGPVETPKNGAPPDKLNAVDGETYQIGRINGHVVYLFPNGSSVLSVPFVAVANRAGWHTFRPDNTYDEQGDLRIQKTLAAFLMALLTVVIFATGLYMLPRGWSAFIAGAFALGTPIWSTASRGMWSQTWLVLLEGLLIFQLVKCERGASKFRPIIIATFLSWMCFVRPTAAIPCLCVTVYVVAAHREHLLTYVICGMLWFAAFIGYSELTFGQLLPGYYSGTRLQFEHFVTALGGTLISPSRGLLVFVPMIVFILYRVARYWNGLPMRRLAVLALGTIALQAISVAGFGKWWGGYSYGPRLLIDTVPWLALLAMQGIAANSAGKRIPVKPWELTVGAILISLSVAINARGALSFRTQWWNAVVDVDNHPERVFDWSYPQFMAGLIAPPKYQ
ncbi:MAG TPA: hypothetical protein VIO10_06750 [Candidatus Binatus sp.]